MIAIAIICVAAAFGLFYATRPLFKPPIPHPDGSENDAQVRKMRALEAILDLEAEMAAGKLAADDFAAFKEMHEQDALTAMRELDVAARAGEDDLEAEIAAARAELR